MVSGEIAGEVFIDVTLGVRLVEKAPPPFYFIGVGVL